MIVIDVELLVYTRSVSPSVSVFLVLFSDDDESVIVVDEVDDVDVVDDVDEVDEVVEEIKASNSGLR